MSDDPEYPRGKLNEADEGALNIRFAASKKTRTIVIDFGKPIVWIGLGTADARSMAKKLNELADSLEQ